jgi:hypothetical protein
MVGTAWQARQIVDALTDGEQHVLVDMPIGFIKSTRRASSRPLFDLIFELNNSCDADH